MNPVVAVITPGAMGAPVGKRLVEHGLTVLTSLHERSAATVARARGAGLTPASDDEIAGADFILSILPPGDALPLAQRFAPALAVSNSKPAVCRRNISSSAQTALGKSSSDREGAAKSLKSRSTIFSPVTVG